MRTILVAITAILVSFSVTAQQTAKQVTASNGQTIGFLEFRPSDYNTGKHPVIIFLHGIGERGNGKDELSRLLKVGIPKLINSGNPMRFYANGKWESFIVLSPQLPKSSGNWNNMYVDAMLEYAAKNLNADPDRIYLTGMSLGGGGTWAYVSGSKANASKLAAIVPICGTCRMSNASFVVSEKVAVWAFHAKDDKTVGVNCTNNAVSMVNILNPEVPALKTIWPTGGHGVWDRVYNPATGYVKSPNIYEWLLTKRRGANTGDDGEQNYENVAPVANAGNDLTVFAGSGKLRLDGSKSNDSDGQIVKYSWKKVSGPNDGSLSNLTNSVLEIAGLKAIGTYIYELTVTDDRGGTATDQVKVIVQEKEVPNKRPVANAGTDITLTLPASSAALDATASKDDDGSIVDYDWSYVSGPKAHKLVNKKNKKANLTGLEKGEYVFRVKVTDDKQESSTDDVSIKVLEQPKKNKAPVAKAGSNINITLPTNSVTLDGSASADQDGSIKSFEWKKLSGPAGFSIESPGAAKTRLSNLEKGTYAFRLQVTDNDNAVATADVTVNVNAKVNKAPVAKAGSDISITLPTNSITLKGDASADSDGKIASYSWTKTAGPSGENIKASDKAVTTIESLRQGNYTFRLTIKDEDGAQASDDVNVEVKAEPKKNQAPVAKAGSDLRIQLPENTVLLSAKGSADADGKIVSYEWFQAAGATDAIIENKNTAETRIKGLKEGAYRFRVTVKDDEQATSWDDVIITVLAAPKVNKAPIVMAGADLRIELPTNSVQLADKGSADPDGKIIAYEWAKTSGPGQFKIANSKEDKTTVSELVEGTYTFRLTVTDNDNARASDDVIVTVVAKSNNNQKPVARTGTDITLKLPTNHTSISAEGSFDPDGNIVSYEWVKLLGPNQVVIRNANSQKAEISNLGLGRYVFRVKVTDNDNAVATSDIIVTVKPNQAPTVDAGLDLRVVLPNDKVQLKGAANDADGRISEFKWTKLLGPDSCRFSDASSASPQVSGLVEGRYVFRLRAYDNDKAYSENDVIVTVVQNKLPVARASQDQTVTYPLQSAVIEDAGSYDRDGKIASYEWSKVSGPAQFAIESRTNGKTRVSNLQPGDYVFRLTVTDSDNGVATDDVRVIVEGEEVVTGAIKPGKSGNDAVVVEELKAYPNPAISSINLRFANNSVGRMAINIYDISGRLVQKSMYEKKLNVFQQSLNVSSLKAGVYQVEIVNENQTRQTIRFVKQ